MRRFLFNALENPDMAKKRRIFGKILIGLLLAIVLLFGTLILLVYLNRDKIAAQLKEEINNSVNAKFDFGKVGLSLKHFPALGLCLEDFSLVGINEFSYDTLASGEALDVSVSLKSLLRSSDRTIIENVHFEQPRVRLVILEDGRANYDIVKESEGADTLAAGEETAVQVELRQYSLRGAHITYDDRQGGMLVTLAGLDHRGSGNFTLDEFDLNMVSRVEKMNFNYGGVNYLKDVNLNLENTLHVNLITSRYDFGDADLRLNALKMLLDGFVQMTGDSLLYNLDFSAPGNDFKELLSILPYAYTKDFNDMKASGSFSLGGSVKSDGGDFPAFDVRANVDNASFKYPDLPMGFDQIRLNTHISNPGTTADATLVNVQSLKWILGNRPFDASFVLKTPISDLDFSGKIEGSIDLATIQKAFPMEGVDELSGILNVNVAGAGRMSSIEAGQYENVSFAGTVQAEQLRYKATGEPLILLTTANMDIRPERISIPAIRGYYGDSDFDASANLENGLLLMSGKGDISGNARLKSRKLNLNTFMGSSEPGESNADEESAATIAEVPEMYEKMQLTMDLDVDTLLYEDYTLYRSQAKGSLNGQRLNLNSVNSVYEGQELRLSGNVDNLWNYMYKNQELRGDLIVNAGSLNLNPFMDYEESTTSEGAEETEQVGGNAYAIPKEYNFNFSVTTGKLVFQNFEFTDFSGLVTMKDGRLDLKNLQSKFLGGNIVLNGTYDTSDPANPLAKLSYNIDQMAFQQTFNAISAFAKLAPIAKYIEGNFNSNLSLETRLTSDLSPVMSSIEAQGLLHTLRGEVKDFPPLEAVSNFLQLQALKKINLQETKNRFQIVNGTVFVEPFNIKAGDITMNISGQHSLDQTMDYKIQMELPFDMIKDKIDIGKPLANIREQAAKFGIQLKEGIRVNLLVGLTGSIQNPKTSVKLLSNFEEDILGSAKEQIAAKIDSLKEVGKQKVDSVKAVVQEKVEEKKEDIVAQVNKQITSIRSQAQSTADALVSQAKTAAEKVRAEGYSQADNLVAAAGDDPFKKIAAKKTSDKLKQETDKRADQIIQKAQNEANSILQQADMKADSLRRTLE